MGDSASNETNNGVPNAKLPFEQEHLDALQRMRMLQSYYSWVLELLKPYLGRRVLDAGCGVGNFTALLEPLVDYALAVDLSSENLRVLERRFAGSGVVEVSGVDLDEQLDWVAAKKLDTVVCLDVLEHVVDDVALLRQFHDTLQPGGHLLLKVPACPFLFGSVDVASGHHRRYTPSVLSERAEQAGLRPLVARYMNLAGVLPYFLKSRLAAPQTNFSRTFKPWQLSIIDRVMPILKFVDRVAGPPLGLSAILIARKPA